MPVEIFSKSCGTQYGPIRINTTMVKRMEYCQTLRRPMAITTAAIQNKIPL